MAEDEGILSQLEKKGKSLVKGGVRRGKKLASDVEKKAEKVVKSAKGYASQAAEKLKKGTESASTNVAQRKQLEKINTTGGYGPSGNRWK
jgi:hypothetical protein